MRSDTRRVVCWFSCGAASACATKLALKKWPNAVVAYCASTLSTEHPDNGRFLNDCERWFGRPVQKLYADKYADIWDVFRRTKWLVGVQGARCTTELKKLVRRKFERPDDIQVFGFDASESHRADRFRGNNPATDIRTPLIDAGINKAACLRMLDKAGIELPAMYRLGYRNNNCIGCVKGQAGYWNKIRIDFPEVFNRMARMEREVGAAICKTEPIDPTTGKRQRIPVYLDELDPNAGRYEGEPAIQCGVLCQIDEQLALWPTEA
jgi:hypothetical protein